MTAPSADDREMQLGIDAFSVRHHSAEALVRFLVALSCARSAERPGSVWAELSSGPTRLVDVANRLRSMDVVLDETFLTPQQRSDPANVTEEAVRALRTCGAWVNRSIAILCGNGLDTNAGNNKLKHGLAIRGHGDELISMLTHGPVDGKLALSAAQAGVPLIDAVSMEFLTRHRSGRLQGSWEVTLLNLDPSALLAEALMIVTVYGAAFASAAAQHFLGRAAEGPRHPGLPLGPQPDKLSHRSHAGLREALTTPETGEPARRSVVAKGSEFVELEVTSGPISAVIVDDVSP